MDAECAEALVNVLREFEREAWGVHLHRVPAYRVAVKLLHGNGFEYESPEAALVYVEVSNDDRDFDSDCGDGCTVCGVGLGGCELVHGGTAGADAAPDARECGGAAHGAVGP
jgi:hypothetical protein